VSPLFAKLTGKVSGSSVGLLSAVDDEATSATTGTTRVHHRAAAATWEAMRIGAVYRSHGRRQVNRVASLGTRLVFGSICNQLQARSARRQGAV
jgi:hypothetical protein